MSARNSMQDNDALINNLSMLSLGDFVSRELHSPTSDPGDDGSNASSSGGNPVALGRSRTRSIADSGDFGSQRASDTKRVNFLRSAARKSFSLNSMKRQQGDQGNKRRKMTIHRGETEMSAFRQRQQKEESMYKVVIDGDDGGIAISQTFERIDNALSLREKYTGTTPEQDRAILQERLPRAMSVQCKDGIYQIVDGEGGVVPLFCKTVPWKRFAADIEQLLLTVENTMCRKAAAHRLDIIEERSKMFFLLNTDLEERHSYRKSGGCFSAVTRVDNSIRMSRAFNSAEMLEFFASLYHHHPHEVVAKDPVSGQNQTLHELFHTHGVSNPEELTTQALGYHPPPPGKGRVDITEDAIAHPLTAALHNMCIRLDGRFSHALYKAHLNRIEDGGYESAVTEHRLSVYGTSPKEISEIARFLKKHEIGPYTRNMWFLHVRYLEVPKHHHSITTLQEQFDNIFLPLINATINPEDPANAAVLWLMPQLGGLHVETDVNRSTPTFGPNLKNPSDINFTSDGPLPHDLYYLYYTWANLNVLNALRRRRGQSTLQLRLNGTDVGSMLGGYLMGDVVAKCSSMVDQPVLQYLYGMHRIGMTVSPLTDNARGLPYEKHPLHRFLDRCLNITLCTESPMHTHHSSNPLLEEYGTAQKLMRLSAQDVTELMRNSVMMSSFPSITKAEWLGDQFHRGTAGNVPEYSQVTNARLDFRDETWAQETEMLRDLYRLKATEGRNRGAGGNTGLSRWHYLSSVKDVEYFNVVDRRIRYPRTVICGPHKEDEVMMSAAPLVAKALRMRNHYQWKAPRPWEAERKSSKKDKESGVESDFQRQTGSFNEDDWTYQSMDSVFFPFLKTQTHKWKADIPTLEQFHKDFIELKRICDSVEVKEFAFRRLDNLDHKFRLHLALNHANEAGMTEKQETSNRDIYQATKVDTHVHMAAGMTAKQMKTFVLNKILNNRDDIAMKTRDGQILTLGKMMDKCNITHNLTIDQLSVQADHTLFERFDNFNNRYNPMENPDLRTLLLKTDNFMNGRYFAEMVHLCFDQMEKDSYTFAENRVSVYGISLTEWDKLAAWFDTHGMSCKHNKWMIQVPRVYKVFRGFNTIGSFGQYLQNIFKPLWEVSLHPSENPMLHNFLKHVSGFDSVDNEATLDLPFSTISPWEWTHLENPPYNYYMYHLYANIRTLNEFRASRGFSTFDFRPHCGESGSDDHMLGCFLCAGAIGHGINLRNDPSIQYLYYLSQIGLHVSPLSNNALFVYFLSNPFPDFFRRGLNVSLSTDDPLMFHQTQEPLIEEYSIAARVWGLSPNDLCEIARNSTLQCGFDNEFKRQRIGDKFYMSSSLGNDPLKTHLSDIRVAFRFETYHTEMGYLESVMKALPGESGDGNLPRWKITPEEEHEINENQRSESPEEVVLSTHDQAMEKALRDIEQKRELLKIARTEVERQRHRHKGLVENLTEIGVRRQQAQLAAEAAANRRAPIVYKRESTARHRTSAIGAPGDHRTSRRNTAGVPRSPLTPPGVPTHQHLQQSAASHAQRDVSRILHWQPSPPTAASDQHRNTKEVIVARESSRPLPSAPALQNGVGGMSTPPPRALNAARLSPTPPKSSRSPAM